MASGFGSVRSKHVACTRIQPRCCENARMVSLCLPLNSVGIPARIFSSVALSEGKCAERKSVSEAEENTTWQMILDSDTVSEAARLRSHSISGVLHQLFGAAMANSSMLTCLATESVREERIHVLIESCRDGIRSDNACGSKLRTVAISSGEAP